MTSVYESARKLLFITQRWWYKIKRVRVDLNPNASQAKHSTYMEHQIEIVSNGNCAVPWNQQTKAFLNYLIYRQSTLHYFESIKLMNTK